MVTRSVIRRQSLRRQGAGATSSDGGESPPGPAAVQTLGFTALPELGSRASIGFRLEWTTSTQSEPAAASGS
jgi:hypothetical protein